LVPNIESLSVFAERRKRVLKLAKGKGVVVASPENIFYLTDFWGGAVGIVHPEKVVMMTGDLEADRAEELAKEAEVVVVKEYSKWAKELERRLAKGKSLVDDDRWMTKKPANLKADRELFMNARRVKDEVEIERIGRASQGLDKIFAALPSVLKPGKTEWEVASEVMRVATKNQLTHSGSDGALSPTIIASGPNGANGHAELTNRKLREGDFVVADIFFRYKGYNSDETRTFAVGTASAEMKKHYDIVLEAQEAAMSRIGEGKACSAVNNAAVAVLRKHKVEKYLTHSIGHGVGIYIHELPWISKQSKTRLLRNDIVTDEPGLYFPGKYGIRIEDTVKTEGKAVPLTKATKDLVTTG
jgi:Xaa-Pro aminopeptidase